MNREFKFRVWDNVDYMSSAFTLEDLQKQRTQFTNDCKVMQFTGIKSTDGKELYEGDIVNVSLNTFLGVKFKSPEEIYSYCELIWDEGGWKFKRVGRKQLFSKFYIDEIFWLGNIYENPDLVRAAK